VSEGKGLKAEQVSIDQLSADPANARLHSRHNLEAIKGSLQRFGQQKPIVVDKDGVVRAGNGTLEAAISLGWQDISVVRTDLEGSEATAYAIADNRAAELATWDTDVLTQSLQQLEMDEDGPALEGTGFSIADVQAFMDVEPDQFTKEQTPAQVQSKPSSTTKAWDLGEHQLICSSNVESCTECHLIVSTWEQMTGKKAHVIGD
jgi:hypothetical protein